MRHYSVKEASLILGFSTNSIYKFLDQGRLKGNRGNSQTGRFKIPHSSLEKFLGTSLPQDAINAALMEHVHQNTHIKKENSTPTDKMPKTVIKLDDSTMEDAPDTALPVKLIRLLIVIGLIILLIDTLFSNSFSLFQQITRLVLMGILIVLTYQFGGLTHSSL